MNKSGEPVEKRADDEKVWSPEALAFFAAPPDLALADFEILIGRPVPIDDSGLGIFDDEAPLNISSLPDHAGS